MKDLKELHAHALSNLTVADAVADPYYNFFRELIDRILALEEKLKEEE